jgi:hypothetical protein
MPERRQRRPCSPLPSKADREQQLQADWRGLTTNQLTRFDRAASGRLFVAIALHGASLDWLPCASGSVRLGHAVRRWTLDQTSPAPPKPPRSGGAFCASLSLGAKLSVLSSQSGSARPSRLS